MPMNTEEVLIEDVIAALRTHRLFRALRADELSLIAGSVEVFQTRRGDTVCTSGHPADALWFLLSGTCFQAEKKGRTPAFKGLLEAGSSWGDECLQGNRYPATVQVLKPGLILCLRVHALQILSTRVPRLAGSLYVAGQNSQAAKGLRMDWLEPGETLIYAGRRHPAILMRRLILPVILLFIALLGLAWSWYDQVDLIGWASLAGGAILAALIWAAWRAVDWWNDAAVVTDLRVAWLERVAWVYDSRNEAPLSMVQSVDVQTTQLGRLLGYGHVIVHTVNGPLLLTDVPSPDSVAAIIYDQWQVSQETRKQEDNRKIEAALRESLRKGESGGDGQQPEMKLRAGGGMLRAAAALFSSRVAADGEITYRKHGFILFKKTWQPVLILMVLAGLGLARLAGLYDVLPIVAVAIILLILMIPIAGWWAYQYQDWRNDVYQIQGDSIIVLERKPFGDETRNVALLENILSIQYKRSGLIGALMNYGTVSIAVGTNRLEFKDVYDPSRVQREIFSAMTARDQQRRTQRVSDERERADEWIATYNRIQDEDRNAGGEITSTTPEQQDIS